MKIKIKLPKKFQKLRGGQKTDWQKAYFWSVLICIITFVLSTSYLFFKPVDKATKEMIDNEVESTNILFDEKTINAIKQRLELPTQATPQTGKNPFIP